MVVSGSSLRPSDLELGGMTLGRRRIEEELDFLSHVSVLAHPQLTPILVILHFFFSGFIFVIVNSCHIFSVLICLTFLCNIMSISTWIISPLPIMTLKLFLKDL